MADEDSAKEAFGCQIFQMKKSRNPMVIMERRKRSLDFPLLETLPEKPKKMVMMETAYSGLVIT